MTLEDVLSDLKTCAAEIDAQLAADNGDDLVLAWDNGLAVKFYDNVARAVHSTHAEAIVTPEQAAKMPEDAWAYIPNVRNGHGEQAKLMKRRDLLAAERVTVLGLIETFSARADA